MVFRVKDRPAILDRVKLGDKVKFAVDKVKRSSDGDGSGSYEAVTYGLILVKLCCRRTG